MQFLKFHKYILAILVALFSGITLSLTELGDEELSDISGQASLLNVDKYNYENNNFYRLTLNASIESSVNIEKLLLKDADGNPQIDIDNLSINGGDDAPNGLIPNASVSSATMTNPFIEFAFKGDIADQNASTREIIGVRFGAGSVNGFMSFGNQDADAATGTPAEQGLNLFRGYMKVGEVNGTAQTLSSADDTETNINNVVGLRGPFNIDGKVNVIDDGPPLIGTILASAVTDAPLNLTVDMKFPSVIAPVNVESFEVIANTPISFTELEAKNIPVDNLKFWVEGEGKITATVLGIPIKIGIKTISQGEATTGLKLDSTVKQDLRYIHRTKLTGGFYTSAQNRALKWKGAQTNDIAQPGWWMSIGEPVDLGAVKLTNIRLPDDTLKGINAKIGNTLSTTNIPQVPSSQALAGLGGVTELDLGGFPITGSGANPQLFLGNQNLGPEQREIRNCWNGALGC